MFSNIFTSEALAEAWNIIRTQFPLALWETFYVTVLATAFAIVIGLPLGVLLVVGEKGGIKPMPKTLMAVINFIINILRSVPFLILMILVFPLTRAIVGTTVGTVASIVPLVIAAFPFVARLVESCLREVNPNLIEMAQSTGATPFQIICKVMIPESVAYVSDYAFYKCNDPGKRPKSDQQFHSCNHYDPGIQCNERHYRRRRSR